jgi:hypothetical protein
MMAVALSICASAAQTTADPLDVLVRAYPDMLSSRSGNTVVFRDGTRMVAGNLDTGAPFEQVLANASIRDMFLIPYPDAPGSAPPENFDPGRFRNKAFFDRMYGDCRKGEVEQNLVSLVWLPKSWGRKIVFTRVNGAAESLKQVSAEIDALPPELRRAAYPIAGTYACRGVADNGQPSMHAYGAAIDLNLDVSNYWLWDMGKNARTIPYRNRMPLAIVGIFRRHGFIWGGAWYHYDTMHFEYRPELLTH